MLGIPIRDRTSRFRKVSKVTDEIISYNPTNGQELGRVKLASAEDYDRIADNSVLVFERWRMLPAPKRGEIVREIGDALREKRKTSWAAWSRLR